MKKKKKVKRVHQLETARNFVKGFFNTGPDLVKDRCNALVT